MKPILLLTLAWLATGAAIAETPAFKDADLKLGERLIRESKCSECHVRRVGGDGSAIYRPKGRIGTPAALRAQVEYCSTQLNLQFFPEDVEAVSAVLNRDHYHFR
ncbi:hypothetical protein [Ideonella sp.]|uniref:hypothetical protein n=1 Tax=Ideonella sp. TaxID=1929293 RepID=UPI002B498B51|nr:hypothetical protein [Ideonella sp.]HJV67766.1 hypothetical protein [Ideonella sp.]